MESLESFDVHLEADNDNVIDLNHERATRAARKKESERQTNSDEVTCEGGVCSVSWKPQRPAA